MNANVNTSSLSDYTPVNSEPVAVQWLANVITLEQAIAQGSTPGELRILANSLERIVSTPQDETFELAWKKGERDMTSTLGGKPETALRNFDPKANLFAARRLREVARMLQKYRA